LHYVHEAYPTEENVAIAEKWNANQALSYLMINWSETLQVFKIFDLFTLLTQLLL
jgi:hypothetical protein